MANDIDKTSPHYKGEFGSIYEVNQKFPNGGVAGDYVEIDGWAHYWNADRGTWCVNAQRDSYWDELITGIIEKFKLFKGATYMGVAGLDTVPAKAIGAKMYYFATVAGTYKNFGELVVPQGINVLYSENGSNWVCSTLLEVAQELGVSTRMVVSQKALNEALAKKANTADVDTKFTEEKKRVDAELGKKFDKTSVAQDSGDSEELVMSQKAVSNKLNDLSNVTKNIHQGYVNTEEKEIVIKDDSDKVLVKITDEASDFTNLTSHGKKVLTEENILFDNIKDYHLLNKRLFWSFDNKHQIKEFGRALVFSNENDSIMYDKIGIIGKVEKDFTMSFRFDFDKHSKNTACWEVCFVTSIGITYSIGSKSDSAYSVPSIYYKNEAGLYTKLGKNASIYAKINIMHNNQENKTKVSVENNSIEFSNVKFIYFNIGVSKDNRVFLYDFKSTGYNFTRDCFDADFLWSYPVVTFENYIAFAYYDKEYSSNKQFIIERYNVEDPSEYKIDIFKTYGDNNPSNEEKATATDLHNYLEMNIDNDGYLHLIGNCHVQVPLYYYGKITGTESLENVWNTKIKKQATYPQMFHFKGDFYLTYRELTSGNGKWKVYKYNHDSKEWEETTEAYIADGSKPPTSCPYFQRWAVDEENGTCYNSWCWRKNGDNSTNYDISFIKTEDFKIFKNYKDENIELPITTSTYKKSCFIHDYPIGSGLLNQNWILTAIVGGEPKIIYMANDSDSCSQLYLSDFKNIKQLTIFKVSNKVLDARNFRFFIMNNVDDKFAYILLNTKKEGSFIFKLSDISYKKGEIYEWMKTEKTELSASFDFRSFLNCSSTKTLYYDCGKLIIGNK